MRHVYMQPLALHKGTLCMQEQCFLPHFMKSLGTRNMPLFWTAQRNDIYNGTFLMQIFLGQNVSSFVKLFSLIDLHVNNTADQWVSWTYPCAQSHVEEPVWWLKEVELVYEQCNIDTHPRSLRGKKAKQSQNKTPPPFEMFIDKAAPLLRTFQLTKTIHFGSSLIAQPERFTILLLCCNNPAEQNLRSRGQDSQEAEDGSARILLFPLARGI